MDQFYRVRGDVNRIREWLISVDNIKNDALYNSAIYGSLISVRALIEAGASAKYEDSGAMQQSARYGRLEIVRELIKAGADVHSDNNYALHVSIKNGYFAVARELIKYSKYINVTEISIKSHTNLRANHYVNLLGMMLDLPHELYDEIAPFI